ncbi:MAG TPA: CoA transferase [Acidimicrobiales bacterium]|nr:CoA transferase [Acidimicrobiales bacterium]
MTGSAPSRIPHTTDLLAGIRVLELGQYVAAPFAATLFADHGAEVTKIERPGGDPYRADPALFAAWNRGKRSVTLDLRRAEGHRAALELVEGADLLIENLRPGALGRLGLDPADARRTNPRLVTCSISAYGSAGPARDEPGWEPLVHGRTGAQQGLFTGDTPQWLPFPMASVAAALLAVIGAGAALVKRESTGYGQHVETSLLGALLFLNAGPIFHRENHRPKVVRQTRSPTLRVFDTKDGRAVMVNLSGTERWRELCRLVGIDDGGLDFATPEGLAKLSDKEWSRARLDALIAAFGSRTADEWEEALAHQPAAVAKCNTLAEWLEHPQALGSGVTADVEHDTAAPHPLRLVAPPLRIVPSGEPPGRVRRHGHEGGALGGHRVVDLSSFWAGPLAARLLAELGADVVKVEPPGGEGAFALMPVLPNIYVDANRSKRGLVLDLRQPADRARLLDVVAAADVVVENAKAGVWEKLGLGPDELRRHAPALVYARAKGFGVDGPLAGRPTFDYVVQAATGMEMTQGGGTHPRPVNFTANDYGTGLHLAAGIVVALLGRARGGGGSVVESSLMMTATVFQSEQVAQLGARGSVPDQVGEGCTGPSASCRLYRTGDGWLVLCAVTPTERASVLRALGVDALESPAIAAALEPMTTADALALLESHHVPAAASVHSSVVPDDPHVVATGLLAHHRHPAAGRFVQVGIPFTLGVDTPAVRGPAPTPAAVRRRVKNAGAP